MHLFRCVVIALLTGIISASSAFAEREVVVTLRTGTEVRGTLIEETRTTIVVDTVLHNIPYKQTIRRTEIDSIEYVETAPATRREARGAGDDDRSTEEDRDAPAQTRYLIIPIEGVIGIESIDAPPETVTAEGVAQALAYAKRRRVEHIVFTLDTQGGYINEAERIADTINEHSEDFTFHALVRRSISAGMNITYACDRIWLEPDATSGAALSYSTDSTGSAQVDAKMNSIWAAEPASTAKGRGHNPSIARAMVVPEAELYVWEDENGTAVAGEAAPPGVEAEHLDGASTILTLTREQAVRLGVGEPIEGGAASIGEAMEINGWREFGGRYGRNALARASEKIINAERDRREALEEALEIVQNATSAIATVENTIISAKNNDPSRFSYTYYESNGAFTNESKRKWMQKTDAAIAIWRRALAQIASIVEARNKADRAMERHAVATPHWSFEGAHEPMCGQLNDSIRTLEQYGTQLNAWKDEADSAIADLRKNYHKTGY